MKTHWRKAYKSDHLGVADLEEFIEEKRKLIFTISHVRYEENATVAGRKGNFNIAYFREKIKPLVLNATNAGIVKRFAGSSFVDDWKNITVELYINPDVKMKGEKTGGVRIKPVQPRSNKTELTKSHAHYATAIQKLKAGETTLAKIKQFYTMSAAIEAELKGHENANDNA